MSADQLPDQEEPTADREQSTAGKDLLESVQMGDIPGVGMVVIDGQVASGRSRNTPPAETISEVV